MISGFFKSKFFLFLAVLFFVCFIIGYDYAVLTSMKPAAEAKTPAFIPGTGDAANAVTDDDEEGLEDAGTGTGSVEAVTGEPGG